MEKSKAAVRRARQRALKADPFPKPRGRVPRGSSGLPQVWDKERGGWTDPQPAWAWSLTLERPELNAATAAAEPAAAESVAAATKIVWEAPIFWQLEEMYAEPATRAAVHEELDRLIGGGVGGGLKRLASPFAPLQPGSEEADRAPGGGAWSELALFNGRVWNETACNAVPTISHMLRGDSEAANEICGSPTGLGLGPNMCGANVVVTILKLAAGARILPHCGVTNRRLIMQFALRGSAGVEFTVGDEKRGYGGDGHALVFDDSFEHEVWHGGREDRYVILALLRHPDA